MDFCIRTPIQSKVDNGYCSCADGYFGSWHMGEGKCYCYMFNGLLPHKITRPYKSSPF
jgi:predicted nucleic acid-binding Zn finger protein